MEVFVHMDRMWRQKDGYSAGLPIALSIIAARYNCTVRQDLVATGEMTLAGGILPVSEINAKIKAVAAAGKRFLMIPSEMR